MGGDGGARGSSGFGGGGRGGGRGLGGIKEAGGNGGGCDALVGGGGLPEGLLRGTWERGKVIGRNKGCERDKQQEEKKTEGVVKRSGRVGAVNVGLDAGRSDEEQW